MPQLAERLALYLADALARDTELPTNFLERARMAVHETEPKLDDLALALGQPIEDLGELLLKH